MKKILLAFAVLFAALTVSGQDLSQLPQLPLDPTVRMGKLENGLTYYIRHNDKPADRAEFFLATNVGAIQETPDQDGLAHFLEHMCFNGTKNFPGKSLLEYLQSIGAEFGRNINASTGVEQTIYMLNNIPLVRETVVDTCLLILHDYSHFVTCDPVEIDNERGVILEEKRTRNDANWRMGEKAKQAYYKGSKYAGCTIIGSEENLKTFQPESLTNFYHTWYRPDLQAVIVVGDVDVDHVEAKLHEIFADIPAVENPQPKDVHIIPDNEEPIVAIITDPEAPTTSFEVLWKSEAAPEILNGTQVGLMTSLIKTYVRLIMAERFNDITAAPDAPFQSAGLNISEICETCEAVIGSATCKNNEAVPAFAAFLTEIEKMKRFGFTDDEVSRATDIIVSRYERKVQGAESRKNSEFVGEYISHFFDNWAFMDPEMQFEYVKAICGQLSPMVLNQVVSQMITDNNMVVLYYGPEKDGVAHPSETDLLAVIEAVKEADIQPNEAQDMNRPLLDAAVLKGSKVKKEKSTLYGATEWTLKNGLKVVVLPTDYRKDQVIFSLRKDGGKSLIANEDLPSFEENIFYLYQMNTGVSEFSGTDLSKMMAGKNVSVTPFIDGLRHGISGSAAPKDLETAFQLMYLYFMDPRFDENEYVTGIQQLKSILPNLEGRPDFKLQTEVDRTIFGNHPRKQTITMEMIDRADIKTVDRVYRSLYKDVAGATLYIVGNVDLQTLKPLVEKYAGSLTKGRKASEWVDNGEDVVKGHVENKFSVAMETPKTTVFQYYSAYMPYSIENSVTLDALKYITDMVYTATLREEEGGTYGASVAVAMQREPDSMAALQVLFDTNPEMADKLAASAAESLKKLAAEGPDAEQVGKTLENARKNLPEQRINNSYWMEALAYWYRFGEDYDKVYESAVEQINAEKVKAMAEALVGQGNLVEVVMSPQE